MKLEELIDVAGTADWRRRNAEEYLGDDRNMEAVGLLDAIGKDFATLEGGDLHRRIESAFADGDPRASEIVSEELRSVGFHSWPSSGRELLKDIASRLKA